MGKLRATVLPRVFISSVVRNFEQYRQAARRATEAASCEPVLVNEDLPSMSDSSRNACLDAVRNCDALVLVIGSTGGFQAPSGKFVIEEEYEQAQLSKIPVFLFVQDGVARDPAATQLVARLSDYVHGRLRTTFTDPSSLEQQITKALTKAGLSQRARTTDPSAITKVLDRGDLSAGAGDTHVVLAVLPERAEELISPVQLAEEAFHDQLCEIGRRRDVGLFGQRESLGASVVGDAIVIEQPASAWHRALGSARVEIRESGFMQVHVAVRATLDGRDSTARMASVNEVVESDVRNALSRAFTFVAAAYEALDPHQRHASFFMNAALLGLGFRQLVTTAKPSGPWTMRMTGEDGPILAENQPRRVSRNDLRSPQQEIERLMARIKTKC